MESDDQPQEDPVATALEAARGQLAGLQLQQENICEYLESYSILTPLEKNQLWKLVMKKATVYRSQEDELTIRMHPNLPK